MHLLFGSCRKATEWEAQNHFGKLSVLDQLRYRVHLTVCRGCQCHTRDLKRIDRALAEREACLAELDQEQVENLKNRILSAPKKK